MKARSTNVIEVLKRLVQLLLVVVGATFLLSLLLRLLPVGLKELYVTGLFEEDRQKQIKELGLDRNAFSYYIHWLWDFVRGDFGQIVLPGGGGETVASHVGRALPKTLQLVFYTQIFALLVSIPLGIFSAYRTGRRADRFVSYGLFTAASVPNFVLGLLLALIVGVKLEWLPPLGYVPISESVVDHVRGMILPVLSLGIPLIASYTRLLRTDVIATLREDFVTMAVAKGLSDRRILFTHVLRPSSVTLLTSAALNMGALIGGSLVIERVFSIPGLGTEIGFAIFGRQYFALQAYVALVAIGYVIFNSVIDVVVGFVDPRTRERRNA